jgi:hypothetical protein
MNDSMNSAIARGIARGMAGAIPNWPGPSEKDKDPGDAYNLGRIPIPDKATKASADAFELSGKAIREGTPGAHTDAAAAHRTAATLLRGTEGWRAEGMHLKMGVWHDDLAGQTAQAADASEAFIARARQYGEERGIKDSAEAIAAFCRTPIGNAMYQLSHRQLGRRGPL